MFVPYDVPPWRTSHHGHDRYIERRKQNFCN